MDQKCIMISAMDINAFNAEHEAALVAEAKASGESIADGSTVTDAFESSNEMDLDSLTDAQVSEDLAGLLAMDPEMASEEQWNLTRYGRMPSSP